MSRLEAIIHSPLSFRRNMAEGDAQYAEEAETVGLRFDARLFVWHAFPEGVEDKFFGLTPLGPTVTCVLGDEEESEVVATELERLLSALTFLFDVPTEVGAYGGHWTTDPFEAPYARAPRVPGWARKEPPETISLRRNSEGLLKALGWYREGRNSGSPYYRFLAHWNALEAVFYGPHAHDGRAEFVDRTAPALAQAWTAYQLPANPSQHFHDESRHAIAHVFRGEGGAKALIDPDADRDRQRLSWESSFIGTLVPHAIREVYGEPVSATWPHDRRR